jgi:2-polyprenyl-3-methyl-5-hydroxy-6-metoxy-1,4-benzoquinol methylase
MEYPKVGLNQYGYYEVLQQPSDEDLQKYYEEKYYQENKGSYLHSYSDEELIYFLNKNEQKYHIVTSQLKISERGKFLDVGCGEGYALQLFLDKGWEVVGLDYSDFGCKQFNPECLPYLILGDIYKRLDELIAKGDKFDVLLLDNVLEHVKDPKGMLIKCRQLLNSVGVLIIEVPNDFSKLQKYLLESKKIDKPFWVVLPDHLSYFNLQGLNNLLENSGFVNKLSISDHPIDFNLLNDDTNYSKDKSKGKGCHKARVELENLIHSISLDKAIDLYKAYAGLGLGRQIISFNCLK